MAMILPLSPNADTGALAEAVRVVQRGGVLAIPTESFYALAAPALHAQAVQRVNRMKGRPDGKPILVLVADRTQLRSLVRDIPLAAVVLMDHFWPGPLTIIYPASAGVPEALTAGTGTVGIRQSAYPSLAPVLQRLGPLTGTSANRSGEQPACTAAEVQRAFGAALDLILDGGQTAGGLPSTLVDTVGPVRLLREGPISRGQIEAALKQVELVLES